MKEFESYFSSDAIVSYLCKLRVKVAKSRNKRHLIHLLTDSDKFNYHVDEQKKYDTKDDHLSNEFAKNEAQFLKELDELLPSRKKWVTLALKPRTHKKTNQQLSSSDRNFYSLLKTIKSFRVKSPSTPWLIALDKFIADIQNSILNPSFRISSPIVYPKLKEEINEKGVNKCRPISMFSLKDRLILSLTNRFLTALFDKYFEDCSYAFRSKRNKENTAIVTHHDCIRDVLKYRSENQGKALWVVECDMEKFYDSVNHKIVKEFFGKLIERAKTDFPDLKFTNPSHIFYEFLDCYAFNKNVPPKGNFAYWKSYKIPNGEFGWIEKELKELGYYENMDTERIGVPQGGALSGLIANIMLDIADKEVLKTNVFYTRFCDDMLIISPEINECERALNSYMDALRNLNLVPHNFSSNLVAARKKKVNTLPDRTFEPFWKGKSKGPYKWDSILQNGFPWIGFVGYELHHEGYIRVKKKSFQKELEKQKEVIEKIRKAVKSGQRKSKGSVTESAIHRLVGMSVGRVNLQNYKTSSSDLCWKNGFRELTMNKYSVQQAKQLDRNRNRLYYDFVKEMKEPQFSKREKPTSKSRQVIHFDKPFSYYYQVLERKEKESK